MAVFPINSVTAQGQLVNRTSSTHLFNQDAHNLEAVHNQAVHNLEVRNLEAAHSQVAHNLEADQNREVHNLAVHNLEAHNLEARNLEVHYLEDRNQEEVHNPEDRNQASNHLVVQLIHQHDLAVNQWISEQTADLKRVLVDQAANDHRLIPHQNVHQATASSLCNQVQREQEWRPSPRPTLTVAHLHPRLTFNRTRQWM